MLPPATLDAKVIKSLYDSVYIFAVIAFVLVEGLLIVAAFKFRRKSADEMPVQNHGNNAAELTWTVIPALVVAGVFGMAVQASGELTGRGSAANQVSVVHAMGDKAAQARVEDAAKVDLVIQATGHQWFWDWTYKGDLEVIGNSNNNQPLIIPAGKRIRMELTAADVIHAWWVPQLGPMIYVNPGERSYIFIDNVAPGDYAGQCNVYCGLRHALMQNYVKVLPEAEFDAWLQTTYTAQNPGGEPKPGVAEEGKKIFLGESSNARPCWTCHKVAGTKAQGAVAPRDMTQYANYPTIAQVDGLVNNAENLRKWLKDPQSLKKGTAMPNLNLKDQEIEHLIAYLQSLK